MHGHNTPRGPSKDAKLQIHEIFYTIQGEGPLSGRPAVFVRTTGCNLRCWFCDTTWGDETDPYMTLQQIIDEIHKVAGGENGGLKTSLLVLTGGEPLRQPQVQELVEAWVGSGLTVQIETAGTYWYDWMANEQLYIVCSPKTGRVHPAYLTADNVYWKYVVKAGEVEPDGFPRGDYQRHKDGEQHIGGALFRPAHNAKIYLTPMDEEDEEKNLANRLAVAESCLQHGFTAQVQVHKFMRLR